MLVHQQGESIAKCYVSYASTLMCCGVPSNKHIINSVIILVDVMSYVSSDFMVLLSETSKGTPKSATSVI